MANLEPNPRRKRASRQHRAFHRPPDDGVERRIAAESRALGLTKKDYLDLVTRLAQSVRASAWPDGPPDPEILRMLAKQPFLIDIVSSLAGSVWRRFGDGNDPAPQAQPVPQGPIVQPQPAFDPSVSPQPQGYPAGHPREYPPGFAWDGGPPLGPWAY